MPRLFVPAEKLVGGQITLVGEPHRYLTRVLRFTAGARVDLFDGRGVEVEATVLRAGSREVTLALGARRAVPAPLTPPVTLLQGLPRPERMDLIIQKVTELGAARVIPVRTARSAAGQQGRPDRWEKIAQEAARQCGRADSMDVAPVVSLVDAITRLASGTTRVVPWEDAPGALALGQALQSVPSGTTGVDVLIGPEGGLTAEEVGVATGAGFQIVTLGPRILRTETAAIAVLAVIQDHLGALGPIRTEI
ncbi:MAG: 16S rRNA (uracil(1498)-N(3))-methyltransferase [Deltaproteobacteria bacterium]|nr:16S rRNA (uracil(1498)-N(3))-methyltransferase [Deltaproteobacteria bacterium]